MIQAVLSNPSHPEYGVATIPFPIPRDQYAHCMELLEALEIGDAVKADCKVEEVDSFYTVLKRVEMLTVNVEELSYLAKRLDSFDTGEAAQFQAMAHKLELFELKDLINLTFCCQQATVIADFSDLAAIGRDHYMNLHGGSASADELNALDGEETARQLIENGNGTVIPYGVVYDNGMELEQIYDGRFFPCYYYEPNAITVAVTSKAEPEDTNHITWLYLPMVQEEIDRALLRGGITDPSEIRLSLEDSQLPNEVDVLLDMEYEAQKNYYTDKIMENKSWTMADIFADEGITGTSAKKRADFMRMMKWCKQGKIDLILTKSVSRFARNTVDCLNYVRMLKAQGIAVYFEKENINSMDESTELMLTMMGAFAQAESESISGNIQAGKRYAMQRGEATINYYSLYAYEKGPDGNPQIIPEQAEIVREIYQKYLHGDSLNMIRKDLEERHIPNARGGATWTHTAVRGILSNEKYVGDVLMQKTFQQDCISRKTIRNTGQRTMYLVPDHHEAIIDRKTYNAVQTELARRNALKGNTQKSTPSGRSCYTPKYALSDRLICGECGTLYRRCTWVNRGKKHIVWRCISRSDYGKKYCHDSPSVDEQQLQQAILRAINSIMSEKPALVRQVTENLQVLIHPSRSGELTIADIDHQLETLAREFDATFATAAIGNAADYSERFKMILTQQTELKAKRVELERQQAEDAELNSHMEEAADIMGQAGTAITEWNERNIRDLVESVRILSKEKILVRLKSGIEKTEKLQS